MLDQLMQVSSSRQYRLLFPWELTGVVVGMGVVGSVCSELGEVM